MNRAFQLLHSNQLDITPQMRIEVLSPILRPGADTSTLGQPETSGAGNSITVNLKSSPDLLGYETASYAVQAKPRGIGLDITPLYADRHIGGDTERRTQPA